MPDKIPQQSRFRQIGRQISGTSSQYRRLLLWFLRDSLWRYKWLTAGILLTGLFGVSSQVAAIGQVLHYGKSLQRGDEVVILHWSFTPRESLVYLGIVAAAVFLWLIVSAVLIYWSRAWVIKIGLKYDALCSQRILSLFGASRRLPYQNDSPQGLTEHSILQRATGDARFCNRIVRICTGGIIPGITCGAAWSILLYLEPLCTAALTLLLIASVAVLYVVNVAGARHSIACEKHCRAARMEKSGILRQLNHRTILTSDAEVTLGEPFRTGSIKKDLDACMGRLISVENSSLINNMLLAIGVPSILLYIGVRSIQEMGRWDELVVYIVAIRYFLVNLKQFSRTLTSMNRFFPQLKRYYLCLKSLEPKASVTQTLSECEIRQTSETPIDGSQQRVRLLPGTRLGLIVPYPLNRFTLARIADTLCGNDLETAEAMLTSAWFAASKWGFLPGSLRSNLGLDAGLDNVEFQRDLEGMGIWESMQPHLKDLMSDRTLTPKRWDKLEDSSRYALSLIACIHSGSRWIFLDDQGLQLLSRQAVEYALNKLHDRFTVIVFHRNFSNAGGYRENCLAVLNGTDVQGIGPVQWVLEQKDAIRTAMDQAPENLPEENVYDVDSEVDDMDFEE